MRSAAPGYLVVASEYHLGLGSRRSGRVVGTGESLDLVEASRRSLSGCTTIHVSSCPAGAIRKKYLDGCVLAAKIDGFECGRVGNAEDVANIVGGID
jgi:hypothetical protein